MFAEEGVPSEAPDGVAREVFGLLDEVDHQVPATGRIAYVDIVAREAAFEILAALGHHS